MRLIRLSALMVLVALLAAPLPAPAQDKTAEIAVTIEKNRFSPEEIKVKAGKPFVLVVTNKDAKPEEFESKELRIEKVIPAGKTASIRVRACTGTYLLRRFNPRTAQAASSASSVFAPSWSCCARLEPLLLGASPLPPTGTRIAALCSWARSRARRLGAMVCP